METITVFGATGAQGGGLARAILADPARRFRVRAVTRCPSSAAAQALARAGAEVVFADLDDAASVARALAGAYGAFCVTSFWEHMSAARELAQADTLAAGAARAGVRHVVWSTLEDTRLFIVPGSGAMPVLDGRFNVPHFDAKGEANRAFVERGVPVTLLYTSAYFENLVSFGMGPQRRPDGTLALVFPIDGAHVPWIAAEDIGRCAFGIFVRGTELVGKSIGIAGEHLTGAEMARLLTAAVGRQIAFDAPTPEQFRASGAPAARELGNMWQFKRDCAATYCGARNVDVARELNPQLQTFRTWLATNAPRIPLPR